MIVIFTRVSTSTINLPFYIISTPERNLTFSLEFLIFTRKFSGAPLRTSSYFFFSQKLHVTHNHEEMTNTIKAMFSRSFIDYNKTSSKILREHK